MITDALLDRPWLTPLALVLIVAAGLGAGGWLTTRPRVARSLLLLSLVPVAALTLVPVDRTLERTCVVQWSLPTLGRVELAANVVLFVTPTLLAALVSRRPWLVLLLASATSAGIEAVQALVPAIGRSCDTTDWSSNTLGALVGAAVAALALRRRPEGRTGSAGA